MTARLVAGERSLAPAELDEQVRRAAIAMASAGIEAGDTVGLLLRNDFPFFVASLAARWLGAYATPVNWHSTPDEISYVLRDSGAKILIGHTDLLSPLTSLTGLPPVIEVSVPRDIAAAYGLTPGGTFPNGTHWDDWLAGAQGDPPTAWPFGLSAMIYTSGTTGRPKGVRRAPLTPENDFAQQAIFEAAYGLSADQPMVVMMTGPMYHSAPNSYGLTAAGSAEKIVLQPRFDAERLLELVERHRVTHMHMVPTMFVRLLKLPEEVRARYDLSSLRFVVHGAAPCPVDVKRRMIGWWGPVIHEYYGSTETGLVTVHDSATALARPGTVGRALPGVTVRVLGEEGQPLPPGGVGDVYVRSIAVPDFTYHGREDERAAMERGGFMTVGDIGWLDEDGYLFLCDRRRDMIISGGVNIYPAEIEAALLAIAGVRDCAVFGVPDDEFGESVCAWIEPDEGVTLTKENVCEELATRLSRYKLPKVVEFAAELPREDSGKIFKRRLREPYWSGADRTI
ncbi:acyl-CoA synthetase [Amycolatopsis pigmentata]|uniref:Acyl-CoA synthetase n=1 Tax=Amycolatopsis pigmentata TaxID=450801 RepID=A0ABW5FXE9_9PSEU